MLRPRDQRFPVSRLPLLKFETRIERSVCGDNAEAGIKDHQRLPHRLHNGAGIVACAPDLFEAAFHGVRIDKSNEHAVDSVIRRPVRPNAHGVVVAFQIPHLLLLRSECIDGARDERLQIGQVQIRPEILNWPANIGGNS